tara:strand:- start:203 stop:1630 length:1428 start_codon:yes stop_codon:yes gene_type:complete
MAYSSIDDPTLMFETLLWSGDGNNTRTITGLDFQPDLTWKKERNYAFSIGNMWYDSVRGLGVDKHIDSTSSAVEGDGNDGTFGYFTGFASGGFSVQGGSSDLDYVNKSGHNYCTWNWLAGGTTPAITYTVKVVSDSGNKYRFDDFGSSAVTLDLQEGGTYTFDQSDSSNSGHPLRFYTASDKSGGEYTTGVTTTGTAGSSGAKTVITVAASAPTLYYQCSNHAGMGGQANTNSTFGSSNFSGSVQTKVSANTTAGFSVVSYQGTGSVGTFGHGLNSKPNMMIQKRLNHTTAWTVYHDKVASDPATDYLYLSSNAAVADYADHYNDTEPTSSVFTLGTDTSINASGTPNITYCFHEVKGYSKFFTYEGNSSNDGPKIFLGFSPAFIMVKPIDSADNWVMFDNKRHSAINHSDNSPYFFYANKNFAETTDTKLIDITSTGFKVRASGNTVNRSSTFIGMAFAENPLVNSNGVPTNAR